MFPLKIAGLVVIGLVICDMGYTPGTWQFWSIMMLAVFLSEFGRIGK